MNRKNHISLSRFFYNLTLFLAIFCLFGTPPVNAENTSEKKLRVGFGIERPPFVFADHKTGLEIELLYAIAQEMGYEIDPVFIPNTRGYVALGTGEIDIYTIASQEVDQDIHRTLPYISFDNVLISKTNITNTHTNISEIKGTRVAAFQNAHVFIKDIADIRGDLSLYIETPIQQTQVLLLYRDRVDYVFSEKKVFEYYLKSAKEKHLIPHEGFEYKVHRVMPPTRYSAAVNSEKLRDEFNAAFKRIQENGIYNAIMANYDSDYIIQ